MRSEEEMVAYALETEPAVLPYIPELLADFDDLGADATTIVNVLAGLGLPADVTVMDLGCGKGTASVAIAEQLDLTVTGIDLFAPFIATSESLARGAGVADRCRFIHGDAAKLAGTLPLADAVVFAALGDVLGRLDKTIEIIRRYVRPGGFMVICDVYMRDRGSKKFPGFERYATRDTMIGWLTSCGDRLAHELRGSDLDYDDDAESENDLILKRARAIIKRHPGIAPAIMGYAERQNAKVKFISENMEDAVWVLQRH